MFKNYIKVAFRNIFRHRGYSLINILGLAIGMACCILILLWVQHEISYDRFHDNADNIYRVVEMQQQSGEPFPVAVTPAAMGPAMQEDFPEVVNFTRVMTYFSGYVKYNDGEIFREYITLADPNIFDMFTFPILAGEREDMFNDLFSVAISEATAEKYFGEEDPLGKELQINNSITIKVTGVFEDISDNSHLDFDFIIPFEILKEFGGNLEEWGSNAYYTYIQLQENVDWKEFDTKIENYLQDHDVGYPVTLDLQPLTEIHLYSDYVADIGGHGDIIYVRIFSIIAAFILLIACINFMNLSTARSAKRSKEIGLRKVVGSFRKSLIVQFLGESLLMSIIAMVIALILVEISLPYFNNIHGKELTLFATADAIYFLTAITLITGIIAGIYPALYLSSYKPIAVIKNSLSGGSKKGVFRKVLVIIQFSLSIILIISTIIIHKQLNYIFKSDVGYNRDQILSFTTGNFPEELIRPFKEELHDLPGVKAVTASSQSPNNFATSGYGFSWRGLEEDARILIHTLQVDYDFFETFEMEMVAGRSFSRDFSADTLGFVLNEKAAEVMGFENPTEEELTYRYADMSGPVLGVVKNFNFKHVRNKVEPLVISLAPDMGGVIHVKLAKENIASTIEQIETIWGKFVPDFPISHRFLDENFERMYRAEKQMGRLFDYFTVFAIFISCLGLFGLASFMTEQRFKEIGIRKVLGASIGSIVSLLIREFTKWVLIANLIAWPVAWYVMNKWLESFAYRTELAVWIFAVSGLSALIIAVITISFRSFQAAASNPVKALKYE